jgi:hypothetical protein
LFKSMKISLILKLYFLINFSYQNSSQYQQNTNEEKTHLKHFAIDHFSIISVNKKRT